MAEGRVVDEVSLQPAVWGDVAMVVPVSDRLKSSFEQRDRNALRPTPESGYRLLSAAPAPPSSPSAASSPGLPADRPAGGEDGPRKG
jgi:hypothetical protein